MKGMKLIWIAATVIVAGLVFVIVFPQPRKPMDRPSDQSFDGLWVLDPASVPSIEKRTGRTPGSIRDVIRLRRKPDRDRHAL